MLMTPRTRYGEFGSFSNVISNKNSIAGEAQICVHSAAPFAACHPNRPPLSAFAPTSNHSNQTCRQSFR